MDVLRDLFGEFGEGASIIRLFTATRGRRYTLERIFMSTLVF